MVEYPFCVLPLHVLLSNTIWKKFIYVSIPPPSLSLHKPISPLKEKTCLIQVCISGSWHSYHFSSSWMIPETQYLNAVKCQTDVLSIFILHTCCEFSILSLVHVKFTGLYNLRQDIAL